MQRLMASAKPNQHPKYCSALCCCGSRFSNSSLTSSSSSAEPSADSLSNLTHAIVQSRLQRMINESSSSAAAAAAHRRRSSKFVMLLAVDRSSCDPRTDFRESMLQVIVSNGMQETKELRSLLNCYISLNSREHLQVILEAFHEVCSSLFVFQHCATSLGSAGITAYTLSEADADVDANPWTKLVKNGFHICLQ